MAGIAAKFGAKEIKWGISFPLNNYAGILHNRDPV
jgi:hypothetical protein